MNSYKIIESNCIEQMEGDYMPLHDIVREFSGYNKPPSENDFMNSLEFLRYLLSKYKIKILLGPEMKEINQPLDEVMEWLKESWYLNKYDEINYGIWFVKE